MSETIHSDFETIKRDVQNYRISTRVKYFVGSGNYKCKAILFKSYGGRVRWPDRDRLYKSTTIISEKDKIDDVLEDCVESCREKLDAVEDAKGVTVEVCIDE